MGSTRRTRTTAWRAVASRPAVAACRTVLLRPGPVAVAVASVAFLIADWADQLAGSSPLPGAPLDETAHLLTGLLVVWALGRSACERFLIPVLIASVAIDLDHVPQYLGSQWLTAGTPRPYTHSLLSIAVVLLVAVLWRRRRDVMLGIAIGLAVHFWRDLAEPGAGVSLFWPWSDRPVTLPHSSYLVVMVAVIATAAYRSWPRRAASRASPVPQE